MPTTDRAAESQFDFTSTRWSVVFAASNPNAASARESFVGIYWLPLYGFARRNGHPPEDAMDAVQGYLSKLLSGSALADVSPRAEQFRTYLLTGLTNYLISHHRAEYAGRRRPTNGFVYPDALEAEARLSMELRDPNSPESEYDRRCAIAMLDATLDYLREEYASKRRIELFEHLAGYLSSDGEAVSHEAAAARLGMNPGSVRNAIKPFRDQFSEVFRGLVASTLNNPEASHVDEEIRHLRAALGA